MVGHVPELIEMGISNEKSREAARALDILSAGNPNIDDKVLEFGLRGVAERVLGDDKDAFVVSRFLQVCRGLLMADPEAFCERCGCLDVIYKNVGYVPVFLFFDKMFLGFERNGEVREDLLKKGDAVRDALAEHGFVESLFSVDESDPMAAELALRLVATGTNRPTKLAEKLRCEEYVNKVIGDKAVGSVPVMNARLDALDGLLCEATSECVVRNLEYLVSLLNVGESGRIYPFQCTAVNILGRLVRMEIEAAERLVELKVPEAVAALVERFPEQPNLQGRVREMLAASIGQERLMKGLFAAVLPLYRASLMEEKKGWVHGWTFFKTLIEKFEKEEGLKEDVASVIEWNDELEERIQKWKTLEDADYGGEVPELMPPLAMLSSLGLDMNTLMLLKLLSKK